MKKFLEFEMLEGGKAFLDINTITALSPAFKKSAVDDTKSVAVGSILVSAVGHTYPVAGTPEEVAARIEQASADQMKTLN